METDTQTYHSSFARSSTISCNPSFRQLRHPLAGFGRVLWRKENPTIVATSVSGARWCESRGSWARPGPCRSPLSYTLDPFSLTHFFTFIYKQIGVLFKINLDCKSRWLWIFFWITWSAQFNFFIFSWPYFIS